MKSSQPHSFQFNFFFHKEKLLRKRISAFSIDLFAILAFNKIMTVTYFWFMQQYSWPLYRAFKSNPSLVQEVEVLGIVILYTNYFLLSLFLSQGKTLGKTFIGLRVINPENPEELTLAQSLLRTLGYFICYIGMLILFVLPFLSRSEKGLPDWISGTQVISEKQWQEMMRFKIKQNELMRQKRWAQEVNISGQMDELEKVS